MIVKCPNCEKEYSANPDQYTQRVLPVCCNACSTRFEINFDSSKIVICPNCSLNQPITKKCIQCGVVFDNLKATKKDPGHQDGNKIPFQDTGEGEQFNWKRAWLVFSILYLLFVFIDCVIVYPNEWNRPKRDKFNATIDLIEYADLQEELEYIKSVLEDMRDRRMRKSQIFDFFYDSCSRSGKVASIKKRNDVIKAKFVDGTTLKYDDRNSTVTLKTKKIPNENQFRLFPSIIELHTIHENIDLDEKTAELQTLYDFLDYSLIERKYQDRMEWLKLRFILFGFLLYIIPMSIGYFLASIMSWYQRA